MAKKRESKITAKLVELDTKTRKGLYIYIKEPNKAGRYYKYREDIPIPIYKRRYRSKKKEQWKPKKIKRQAERYLKRIQKRPTIKRAIRKGITGTKIGNALTINRYQIYQHKKMMMKPLIMDEELLNIIIKSENLRKVKSRIEYRLEITNDAGETIATTKTFNKEPEEAMIEIQGAINKGDRIEKEYESKLKERLQNLGFQQMQVYKEGTVNQVKVHMIFRKG